MATFEDFLPQIRMRAYGASDPLIEMYLRDTIIEFCERTRLWTRLVQEWAFPNDGRIVLATLDEENEVLESVVPGWDVNRTVMSAVSPAMAGANMNAFAALNFDNEPRGRPSWVFQIPDEANTVGVWPIPDAQYSDITFTIVLKPTRTATVFPDFLRDHYHSAMVEGTLAKIKEVPGQPFTDANGQMVSYRRFERAKLSGQIDAEKGRTVSGDLAVVMRPFATGSR